MGPLANRSSVHVIDETEYIIIIDERRISEFVSVQRKLANTMTMNFKNVLVSSVSIIFFRLIGLLIEILAFLLLLICSIYPGFIFHRCSSITFVIKLIVVCLSACLSVCLKTHTRLKMNAFLIFRVLYLFVRLSLC